MGRHVAVHHLHDAGDTNPHLARMDDVLPVFEQYLENRLTFVTRKNAIVIFNGNHRGALQAVVRAVADGTALTCLAAAKLHPLCALRHVKNRLKAGSVVRAVAKRLRRTEIGRAHV